MPTGNSDGVIAPLRVVRNVRPLLFHDGRLYCSSFDRLLITDDYGATFADVGSLDAAVPLRPILARSALAQRVLRAGVYRLRVLQNGTRVLTFKGGVYVQRPGQSEAVLTHAVDRGSRPVSLAVGRDGLIVFGEYWPNNEREAVRIFASRDSGQSWDVIHTFAPGEIRHVHGISYDRFEDCFWICAGDEDNENQLLRATADFRELRIVRQGGQGNRFYSILVAPNHLLTATDTPSEQNFICIVDKRTGELRQAASIENSNFYSCEVGGRYFVSTNAEPSLVNDINATHVWMGRAEGTWRRVLSFPVDVFAQFQRLPGVPHGLFQYTRVFFPEGDNPKDVLVLQCIGAAGHGSAMLCYDARAIEAGG